MPLLRSSPCRGNARGRLHLFLRVQGLWRDAPAEIRRLLCVLLLRLDPVPTDPGGTHKWHIGWRMFAMLSRSVLPSPEKDWARQPLSAIGWWCAPIAMGVAGNLLFSSPRVV